MDDIGGHKITIISKEQRSILENNNASIFWKDITPAKKSL